MTTPALRNVRFVMLVTSLLLSSSCTAKRPAPKPASQTEAAQAVVNDDSIFAAKIQAAKSAHYENLPIGDRVVAMGKLFLGTPYVAGTLDQDSVNENLVLDLHGLDCVTFYENSLALARVIKEYPSPTLQNYEDELALLRYRDGKRDGYDSRLHYSVDYFYNNEQKGVLRGITRTVGGKFAQRDDRPIDFMTTHRASYRQLRNDAQFAGIQQAESALNSRKAFYYIPKEDVAAVERGIQPGDILGITTNIAGLDCSHTGIAVRGTDGRIHFMHASSLQHKVIVSEEPLADYLTHSSHQTGIIVNRPLEVTAKK